ncbi:MAG: Ig-like domain-containing protein, partial [Caldilineaceae bacterium]
TVTANGVAGSYPVIATASHARNAANFVLYNSRDNHAPVLGPLADQTIRENHPLSFTVTASDSDSDPLTLSLSDLPFGAAFDVNTGLFTWTPTVAQGPGSYTMTITITDNGTPALRDRSVLTITVLDVPLAFDQSIATQQNQPVDLVLVGSAVNEPISYGLATSPTHGTLSGILPDLTYTPETDFVGNDAFTFLVSDGLVESAAATVSITVNPADDTSAAGETNHAPIASSEVLTTEEDTALAIKLDVSDLDGDVLTYSIQSNVQNGSLGGVAPHLIYTPAADYAGEDNFAFVVSDGISQSVAATISFVIVPVNDAPTANDQQRTIDEDQPVVLLLAGDDIDSNVLTYTVSLQSMHGALGGIAPKLIYTPATDFNGNDNFTFLVSDGLTQSMTATVSITVKPVNDAPNAIAQDVHTEEDIPLSITVAGVDVDGDGLNYGLVTQPRYGILGSVAPHLIYTPSANFAGRDAFIFAVNDGTATSTATISITVEPVNDVPLANPQSVSTIEDEEIPILLTSDDVDGDVLTYTLSSAPIYGQLRGSAPNLNYTPDGDFNGGDSFAFSVSDGLTSSLTATVSILVDPVNDVPTTNAQSISTEEDAPIAITLSGSDPDDDALTYSILNTPLQGLLGGIAPHLIYTPTSNYSGIDRFMFQVNDGTADSAPAMVEITITPVNDAPIADGQTITTSEELPVAISLTGNDIDSEVLTYTLLASPTHGALNGIAPLLRYTPTINFSGDDSFTFVISDGIKNSTVATVIVHVTPVNDVPVADDQFMTINEEQPATLTLTASDEDGAALVYTVTTEPIHGSLSGAAPNLVYTPAVDFNGSDAFSFRVSDGLNQSQVATVTMSVMPINDLPTAAGQTLTTHEETPISVTLLATDPDSTVLTYTVVTPPSNGALAGVAPNLLYTPNSDFASSDAFSFVVSDGIGRSTVTTVSIMVEPVNDAPLVQDLNVTTSEETAIAITLAGSDPDGDELSYVVGTKPHHGLTWWCAAESVYTPTANFNSNDSFTYWSATGSPIHCWQRYSSPSRQSTMRRLRWIKATLLVPKRRSRLP